MKQNKKIIIFAICFVVLNVFAFKISFAKPNLHEISNFDELLEAARLTRDGSYQNDNFILTDDIVINEDDQEKLLNSDFTYVSFGSSDYPFLGTFDGDGHVIANLEYVGTSMPTTDTGLFSYTGEGAVIKNLTLKNADIDADYRAGLIAGYSEGTLFENISIVDSHLSLSAANNVLSLITDGGIRGGAIVGEANNSILYNCESINTMVNTNNTSAVSALSGKGLYLGGLVGTSNSTLTEYSSVQGGLVKIYYDVSVGALGGNTLYVGGIIGQMNGSSKVIDSFSTAELNYYCATYLSVGAGNTGNIGGITGAMFGSNNEVIRCHYAGKATSEQYNAILVIPIIQKNVNIAGITNVYEGGKVENVYFKPSLNPDVDMRVLGNDDAGALYGPLDDSDYMSRDFWINDNFDLHGNIERDSEYSSSHKNKWIMDSELGMPIHGNSVLATFDFKGAGEVIISKSELVDKEVSTKDPYTFAVQGIKPSEKTITIEATENEGYRFVSWYKREKNYIDKIEENHDFFKEIFNQDVFSREVKLNNVNVNDNDLFVARYQTRVLFHDIKGNVINNLNGKIDEDTSDDWYDYNSDIKFVDPVNKPSSSNAKLIGFTTIKSDEVGGGYSSITVPELTDIKNKNEFYENGSKITKTMDLYPIYVDTISNIETVFEGNDQDDLNDLSKRVGVGYTEVSLNNDGNVVVSVHGENDVLPRGYKFLGWYENGIKVSKDTSFELTGVDLTIKHTYTARFKYAVEYYVRAFGQHNSASFTDSELYMTKYQLYNSSFVNIGGPSYIKESITHWGLEHVDHGRNDDLSDGYNSNITEPIKVYSHNFVDEIGGQTYYQAFVTTDFPGSGSITDSKDITGGVFNFTPISDRYHLRFWTLEKNNNAWSYANNPMKTGVLDPSIQYKGMAMVSADIIFHKKDGTSKVVNRRYNDNLFIEKDVTYTYKYPFIHTDDYVSTDAEDGNSLDNTILLGSSLSDEEMYVDGYSFLGWISSSEVEKDSDVWNYIYDDGDFTTSDVNKVKPYLLSDDEKVLEAIDVYPVYARYKINTKTNVQKVGNINVPFDPKYEIQDLGDGKGKVTFIIDMDSYIDENTKYNFDSFVLIDNDSEEVISASDNGYSYDVIAGKNYTFMAKYSNFVLLYHINDGETKIEIRDNGDVVGVMPNPTYEIEKYLFAGWTLEKPSGNYHLLESNNKEFVNSSYVVSSSLELWPVYVKIKVGVNSNIDNILGENALNVRKISKVDIDKIKLIATDSEGYKFQGWYKNYKDDNNLGELVTDKYEYLMNLDDALLNEVYTAVYVKYYEVNYHDKGGNVIYTALVTQDNPRSFVTEIIDDGNKQEAIIDYDAYLKIYSSLNNNETFLSWQWLDGDTAVSWNEFYDKDIVQDMDLYPVIRSVSVFDSNNNSLGDVSFGLSFDKIDAYLNFDYAQSKINFKVVDTSYGDNVISYPSNIDTNLYSGAEKIAFGKVNDGVLTLELFGEIVLNASSDKMDSFIIKLSNGDDFKKVIVYDGIPKKIKVPYGLYNIDNDDFWSWRYKFIFGNSVSVSSNNRNANINLNFDLINLKWFDYVD